MPVEIKPSKAGVAETPAPGSQQRANGWRTQAVKIAAGVLALAILIVLICAGALAIDPGPVTAYRMLSNLNSNIYTFKIVPQRPVAVGPSMSALQQGPQAKLPDTVSFSYGGSQYTANMQDLFAQTRTQAFIIVRDDDVIHEKYMNGASRDTVFSRFLWPSRSPRLSLVPPSTKATSAVSMTR